MAITTYTGLKTAIASFLDVTAADISTVIDDIIFIAENRIWAELDTRDFAVSMSATISAGVVAVPSDFLDWQNPAVVDSTDLAYYYELNLASADFIHCEYPLRSSQSRPQHVATEGANFIFGPYPDSTTTWLLKGTYKGKLKRVSASATDNLIFARSPEIYLYASLVEAEKLIGREARIPIWESRYQSIRNHLNGEDTATVGRARGYM